jgi:hypothetical protein
MAPQAREEIVRLRRSVGSVGRPLNFTVRCQRQTVIMQTSVFTPFGGFFRWLSIGACLYLMGCLVVTDMPDVPWIERGIRFGPLPFTTVGWMLLPLIQLIKQRIDSQPRD